MAIPDYQNLMLPLLKIAADGNEHTLSEVIEILAQQFHLSDQERKELLPSGKRRRFDNRVHWARTYLVKANLLAATGRAKFRLTEQGSRVLKSNPPRIDVQFLEQFPEFMEFQNKSNKASGDTEAPQEMLEKISQTPQEILDTSYQSLRQNLAQELPKSGRRPWLQPRGWMAQEAIRVRTFPFA
uniref:Restriction system protein Mrr-like N-terminal domain-containing protein n=1 Tax=Thermosporothrix sp. COM3 TaxID=2490863 RepID=A0A455SK61_9CHLR|nr:hypothetical protein KTC_21000 [Thermosporothrix sp. COM3]